VASQAHGLLNRASEDRALIGDEDRSRWRNEEGGPAFEASRRFIALILSPDVGERLHEVRELVTPQSWPAWREAIERGLDRALVVSLRGGLKQVRHPADGMAYVFWPIIHPDQDEPVLYDHRQKVALNVVTLLEVDGEWLVHQVGEMVPPADLGLEPYSW
jgi:hypothetical protein